MAELKESGLYRSVNLSPSFTCVSSVTSTNVSHQSVQRCNAKTFLAVFWDVLDDKAKTPSKPTLSSSLSNTKSKHSLVALSILHDDPTAKRISI